MHVLAILAFWLLGVVWLMLPLEQDHLGHEEVDFGSEIHIEQWGIRASIPDRVTDADRPHDASPLVENVNRVVVE